MNNNIKRQEIESRIRETSLIIRTELIQQQTNGLPLQINHDLMEEMLISWRLLASLYENKIYEMNLSKYQETEINMNLHIIANYLHWTQILQMLLTGAVERDDEVQAEIFDEHLSVLEGHMKIIIDAVNKIDLLQT